MSLLRLAAPFSTFLFFSGFAAAQTSTVVCTLGSAWMLNSFDQNPCDVAASLIVTCTSGSFTVIPLRPGSSYSGPDLIDTSYFKSCMCSTVTYSLLSACGACQGENWMSWSEYSLNCTTTLPPSLFPNPIPLGTRVPYWALIDITSENIWDSNKAFAVGDFPEPAPGAILGHSTATIPVSSTSSASSLFGESSSTVKPASGASSPLPNSSSNIDGNVIVGAAVGGGVAISLIILIGIFLRRRRREAPISVAPPVIGPGASQPPMDEIQQPLTMDNGYTTSSASIPGAIRTSMPGASVALVRNDPNYPSTFPGYEGVPQTPATPPQGAVPSSNTTGNALATTQTSWQQGYHGLPTV
ncbi:hypothetical protein V8E52_006816 [Russula decolorans]